MEILVSSSVKKPGISPNSIRQLTRGVLSAEGREDVDVGILLVGKRAMRRLNERYTGRTGSTDVLSFGMEGQAFSGSVLGDVYVCVDEARVQARAAGEVLRVAVARLVIHGLLHLLGYDHTGCKRAARAMEDRQENYLVRWKSGLFAAGR